MTVPAYDVHAVIAVVVLFHPTPDNIAHVIRLGESGLRIAVVSNGITGDQRSALKRVQTIILIDNRTNAGLAKALNQGIDQALACDAQYVLLLDQDSCVDICLVHTLHEHARSMQHRGMKLGCIAPRLVDRKHPDVRVGAAGEPLTVATSGSLIPVQAIKDVGRMWEPLFIDGIDHEWCFRARSKGFSICVAADAPMAHDMGDDGLKIGGRYRPIHRSPFRHYHIIRNTLWLRRLNYIPRGWRLIEVLKLGYRSLSYLAFSSDRMETVRSLCRGAIDGLVRVPPLPAGQQE
jgi:rhamnosyltransferase